MTGNDAKMGSGPYAPRRSMLVRSFLCQNVAIGSCFGIYGISVLPMQAIYGVGLGIATLGLSLSLLVMGLFAPVVSALMARFGVRTIILAGIVLSAMGYVILGIAPLLGPAGIALVLIAYALPIGCALPMFGSYANSMLASAWFHPNPGPALGLVNTPLLVALLPVAGVPVLQYWGLSALYFLVAGLHVLLFPIARGIANPPQVTHPDGTIAQPEPGRRILGRPIFWAVVVGAGTLSAVGIIGISHLVSFGVEQGLSESSAAVLVSVMAGGSTVGSYFVGVLAGKIGGARTLALIGLITAAGWTALSATSDLAFMIGITLLVGLGGAGVYPAVNVLAARVFGAHMLSRVIALYGVATLPLTFLLPPVAGVVHDAVGDYDAVIAALVVGDGLVAILFLFLWLRRGRPSAHALST